MGSTINVRLPNRYYVAKTTALQAQNTNEATVPVSLTTNYQVGLNFTQAELTLSLDDFSKRVLNPAMARLASQIDQDGLGEAAIRVQPGGHAGDHAGDRRRYLLQRSSQLQRAAGLPERGHDAGQHGGPQG